jgi:serine/threonine protein kinase
MGAAVGETRAARATIGKYRLLAELGRGGMSQVYLAVMRGPSGFQKLVVIKRLTPVLSGDPEVREMFFAEARLAARLNHPNVVQTYEVGSFEEEDFICMEYLEGQSLAHVRSADRQSSLPLSFHLKVLADVLEGLHYAHELTDYDGSPLHAVHRDVNPNNVFVTYDGQVKLLDFGIAKAVGNAVKTASGVVRGTLAYISPEQIMGTGVDRRSDIFSVGVMLWEASTGRRLWAGMRDVTVMQRVLDGVIPTPRSVAPNVPEEIERICMKALSRDCEARYATAALLRADIDRFLKTSTPPVDARDSGKFIADMFVDERQKVRSIIEAHLAKPPENAEILTRDDFGGALGAGGADSQRPSLRDAEIESVQNVSATPPYGTGVRRTSSRAFGSSRRRTLALSSAALVAVAAALGIARGRRPAETVPSATVPPGSYAPVAATSASPGASAVSPQGLEVRVHLASPQAGARFFLDDEPLPGNPANVWRKSDSRLHPIRVEARGYVPQQVEVRIERDLTLELSLKPMEVASSAPAAPAARSAAPAAATDAGPPKGSAFPLDPSIPWEHR